MYLRFDAERRWALYAWALFLFVLAVLTKSVAVTLPVGIAAGLGTIWVEREYIGASGPAFDFTFIERGLIAGRAIVFYVVTLVWPANLTFVYPRWDVSQSVWWQYLYPLAALLVLAWCWRVRTRTRTPLAIALLFAGTCFRRWAFSTSIPSSFRLWPTTFSTSQA